MSNYIFDKSVDSLYTSIEEGARAGKKNTNKFIEPAQGTLSRAKSKRHHLIFGRRGSGKSSLLYKSAEELANNGHPVALVDLEPFKGHQYPDIIISVLIASFQKFSFWLEEDIPKEKDKRLWYTFFLKKKPSKQKLKKLGLLKDFNLNIEELKTQLHLIDNAELKQKVNTSVKEDTKSKIAGKAAYLENSVELELVDSVKNSSANEFQESFKRNKQEFLLRKILDYQKLFSNLYEFTFNESYLFLDDLYHLLRKDQPDLIDYFHKIAKGNNLWIKIGTIRNRTTWYNHSPQPIGMKIGDDAEEINLDLTLEKFFMSKDFLRSILNIYIAESSAPNIDEILTDGALDRLVLSSGGVARDFLGLFRRSIEECRERLKKVEKTHNVYKIGAEDVNVASGNYGESKKEEFQRDTLEDREQLETAFNKVKTFCLDKLKRNIFLIDQDQIGDDIDLIQELIDLRLIHQIKSRVTVRTKTSKIYRAYLLDVSQYTGERTRRDVAMIAFWKESEKDSLRRESGIYDPKDVILPIGNIATRKKMPTKNVDDSLTNQTKMEL